MKILLVEDDNHYAEAIIRWIEQAGHTVTRVCSYREAETFLGYGIPHDLSIFDWQLGDGYGTDLIARANGPAVGFSSLPEAFKEKGYTAFNKMYPEHLLDYIASMEI